jgi:hypothetical protein
MAGPFAPYRPVIQMIVGRCHVGDSNRYVIRYVAAGHKGGMRGFLAFPRYYRRSLMKMVIFEHGRNRDLFLRVQTGRF